MDSNVKNAIAHFDKKVTDYQIYVDRELQNQDKQIKNHEDYLINTMDSHKKLITQQNESLEEAVNEQNQKIDEFIENNVGGSGGSKEFTLIGTCFFGSTMSFNNPYNEIYLTCANESITCEEQGNLYILIKLNNGTTISIYKSFDALSVYFPHYKILRDGGFYKVLNENNVACDDTYDGKSLWFYPDTYIESIELQWETNGSDYPAFYVYAR